MQRLGVLAFPALAACGTLTGVPTSLADASADVAMDGGAPFDGSAAPASIAFVQSTSVSAPESSPSTQFQLARPSNASQDDILVATLALGRTQNGAQASVAAPADWTRVARVEHQDASFLETYWRRATTSDPASWTFSTSLQVEGVATLAAYSGVDLSAPIASSAGLDGPGGSACSTGASVVSDPNAVVVAAFASHTDSDVEAAPIAAPTGFSLRFGETDGSTRALAITDDAPGPSSSGALSATSPVTLNYCLTQVLVLQPARRP